MNFNFMSCSLGNNVCIDLGEPDQLVGKLVAIMPDYLAIATESEGVVYVQAVNVKAISEPAVTEVQVPKGEAPYDGMAPLVEAENWTDLLIKFKYRLIRINHCGPNLIQGLLIHVRPKWVTILRDMKDYVHFSIHHISSMTWLMNNNVIAVVEQREFNLKPRLPDSDSTKRFRTIIQRGYPVIKLKSLGWTDVTNQESIIESRSTALGNVLASVFTRGDRILVNTLHGIPGTGIYISSADNYLVWQRDGQSDITRQDLAYVSVMKL